MPFVFVEPDPFAGATDRFIDYIPNNTTSFVAAKSGDVKAATAQELSNISRPLSGITAKPNTPAYVQVIDANGRVVKVFNNLGYTDRVSVDGTAGDAAEDLLTAGADAAATLLGGGSSLPPQNNKVGAPNAHVWTDWLLQSVSESRVEKTQILETFGNDYLYAFGQKPRAVQISGILLNSLDYNWRAIFWENWDAYFRATMLVQNNARLYLTFDDIVLEGYPLDASAMQVAGDDNKIQFQFSLFLTNYVNLSARRGFDAANAAATRSRLQRLSAFPKGTNAEDARVFSGRKSVIEMLGYQGFAKAGSAVEQAVRLTSRPATDDPEYIDEFAEIAGQTVAGALSLAATGVMASLSGAASAAAFLRAFTLRTAYETTRFITNTLVDTLEEEGNLKYGEINQWFGLVGAILSNVATADFGPVSAALSPGPVANLLKAGSIDRIVQGMSYALASTIVEATGLDATPKPFAAVKVPLETLERRGGFGIG